ncbi:hypothetical protein DFH08DRAFT_1017230 [Mycena albidolilacea]|uniref:Uncharacterized protein n=1 Tax=Mycena albidolilacea TaxID=1033008 RepID=A0AAD7APP2_9AGAR|nr:hypothetical protein DFH08DRAFT_1017230 [Mycena albidolilacea]
MDSPVAAVGALHSDDMIDDFYRENKVFTSMNQEAARTFKSFVSSPDFGVGGLTKFLVEALCDMPDADVEYTVTDLSYSLANSLAQSFTYKHMVAKLYDLSKTPAEQGLQLGHYDLITGLNVVRPSATSMRSSRRAGGSCANPPRLGAIWNDFIWGSFQGWFGYTDDRTHCTIDETDWRTRLAATGYANIKVCHEDAGTCILFEAEKRA